MPIRRILTGFVNGCFDLLHDGHRKLLNVAANHCDVLTVAVNRDDYCRRLKGPDRPAQPLLDRIESLKRFAERLPCQTIIRVLMEDNPRSLLAKLQPDVYVLGADYRGQILPGVTYCQRVIFVDRMPDVSTTRLLASAAGIAMP